MGGLKTFFKYSFNKKNNFSQNSSSSSLKMTKKQRKCDFWAFYDVSKQSVKEYQVCEFICQVAALYLV